MVEWASCVHRGNRHDGAGEVEAEAPWNEQSGTAILPYDAVRTADDSRAVLLGFLEDAYRAGARTAGRDLADFATSAAP